MTRKSVPAYVRKVKKTTALLVILQIYFLAFVCAWIVGRNIHPILPHPILTLLIADITATIVIYFASEVIQNASVYDPYWSVAPIPILFFYWGLNPEFPNLSLRQIIVMILVFIWAIRLTGNWITGWKGFQHEDWRYVQFREKNPTKFWMINFFGIQLFPTLIVFLACLPFFPIFSISENSAPNFSENLLFWDYVGIIISVIAIGIETLADLQVRQFTADPANLGKTIKEGLWKYSRHPNYLGEISFWWGIYFFSIGATSSYWWMILGAIIMFGLFLGISIPMMEERNLQKRPDYLEYCHYTSKLLLWMPKKRN